MLVLVQEPMPDPDAFERWVFGHADDHLELITTVQRLIGVDLTLYPINVYSKASAEVWKEWHQQMHNDMASILGTTVSDLEEVDFDSEKPPTTWYFLNFRDHQAWHQVLGV